MSGETEKLTDKAKGRAKQAIGDLTGDDELHAEGERDEAAGEAKDKIDQVADSARDIVDRVTDK